MRSESAASAACQLHNLTDTAKVVRMGMSAHKLICALDPPHGFWGFFFHWPAVS
jgi:hypothetical protein